MDFPTHFRPLVAPCGNKRGAKVYRAGKGVPGIIKYRWLFPGIGPLTASTNRDRSGNQVIGVSIGSDLE